LHKSFFEESLQGYIGSKSCARYTGHVSETYTDMAQNHMTPSYAENMVEEARNEG